LQGVYPPRKAYNLAGTGQQACGGVRQPQHFQHYECCEAGPSPLQQYLNAERIRSCRQTVGFVPTADVQIHIPAHIEVVGSDVRTIVIAIIQNRHQFSQAFQCLAVVIILEVIRIDVEMRRPGSRAVTNRGRILGKVIEHVLDEVDATFTDGEDHRAVMANRQAAFDAIFLADGLDLGCHRCLAFLIEVSHTSSLC
jgi:hypothetical protein